MGKSKAFLPLIAPFQALGGPFMLVQLPPVDGEGFKFMAVPITPHQALLAASEPSATTDTKAAFTPQRGLTDERPRAFTIKRFCKAYDIGPTTAYAEIAAGRLEAAKLGVKTLISAEAAEKWLAGLPRRSKHDARPDAGGRA